MIDEARPGRSVERAIVRYDGAHGTSAYDAVVTEEPLEIRLVAGRARATLAVTMRTPGNDFELAAGFVWNEGIVRDRAAVRAVSYCVDPEIDAEQRYNIVNVELNADALPDLARFERHFTVNSSCGVCGRATIDALRDAGIAPLADDMRVPIQTIYTLPERMREAQRIFASTGGLHAAALFRGDGSSVAVREDVGRHNAVDKLVGEALMDDRLPLRGHVLMVSGRTSYEIVQKAVAAGIPLVCGVSAPSSLAVDLAREFDVTLLGFVRGERANVYSSAERIAR